MFKFKSIRNLFKLGKGKHTRKASTSSPLSQNTESLSKYEKESLSRFIQNNKRETMQAEVDYKHELKRAKADFQKIEDLAREKLNEENKVRGLQRRLSNLKKGGASRKRRRGRRTHRKR